MASALSMSPPRFEPRSAVMAALFAGAVLLAWAILPGDTERIAMLERDGRGRDALALLEQSFKAGDRSPRTLFQLQQHYEQFGDLANARRTLEMLTEMRPRDPQALRRLATFYKSTQDVESYIAAMQRTLAVRYFEDTCRDLIGIYRQRGQFAQEQATLQDCRQKGYRRADDLVRLASLLSTDGDLQGAVSLLRSADDLRRLKSEPDRLRLFGILLLIDQPREALRRAVRWVRGQRNDAFVDLLVDQLVLAKRHDTALALVREVGAAGDSVALTAADLLMTTGQDQAARAYLRGWLDQARLTSPALAIRFIRTAIDAGDPENALKGAQRYGMSRVPQEEMALLVDALAAADRTVEAEMARAFLRPETIAATPQLRVGARRAAAAARESGTGAALPPAARELENWRLALWTRLMTVPPVPPPEASPVPQPTRTVASPIRPRPIVKALRGIRKAKAARPKASPSAASSAVEKQ